MQHYILELAYDELMKNDFSDRDKWDISRVIDPEIDYQAGTIKFFYNVGGVEYPLTIKIC